jgi:6-phosphogluconolactonase
MKVQKYADLEAVSRAGAEDFAHLARASQGTFHVALSGGSTPRRMHELLAAMGRDALPWDRVCLWWGDERTVPPEHPDSNFGMAKRTLMDPLGLAQFHRMEGERDPSAAAADYEAALVGACGAPPVLDLIFLGMGPDGHTASLFPGSPAVSEKQRFVVANPVDSPVAHGKTIRITMTAPVLRAARHVRFLVAGADKAKVLRDVLEGPRGRYPSQLVDGADVCWYVDEAAAKELS